jgi:hypothetical protein
MAFSSRSASSRASKLATQKQVQKAIQKSKQTTKEYSTYKANKQFKKQMNQAEKKEPIYKNAYKGYIDAVADRLENGGFEYDASSDPTYKGYSKDYRLLGSVAADMSAENIEGLSGGYGTTYSGTVAQQGLEGYLANEKNIIPALYQQARSDYAQDYANTINQGNLYNSLEAQDFAQFQDRLAKWNENREYYYNKFYNDYMASAKKHQTTKGKETRKETTTGTERENTSEFTSGASTTVTPITVSSRKRTSSSKKEKAKKANKLLKNLPEYATQDKDGAARYLTSKGYGSKAGNLLTRQEYVTAKARLNRNYEAGYTGTEEGDSNYKHKQKVEQQVDNDYTNYLYNYVRKALKGKK